MSSSASADPRSEAALARCPWCSDDPLYIAYHDTEWGVPSRDERHLFEMLCLEGQQAGLSWITVLRKRERYREVFKGFDIDAVARMKPVTIDRIMGDAGVIRHRGKLDAIVDNARAAVAMRKQGVGLVEHLWSFVGGQPVVNGYHDLASCPAKTPASEAMSRDLKKRGFRFVGPTTCYAFMQACGLVNDHLVGCFRRAQLCDAGSTKA